MPSDHIPNPSADEAPATSVVHLRLPADLLSQVDRHRDAMRAAMPGVTIDRVDAIRSLLIRGLKDPSTSVDPNAEWR